MRSTNIIFSADNHLRTRTWADHPTLSGDAYVSFSRVCELAIEQKAVLILGGDLFDSARPEASAVAFFASQMDRLQRADVPVYYIQGNHDREHCVLTGMPASWPQVHTWPKHLHRCTVEFSGWRFYGIDNVPAAKLADELSLVPTEPVVLVTHQSWKDIQQVGRTDGHFGMLPEQVRYMLAGDCHKHGGFVGANAAGLQVSALSPGSGCLQDQSEDAVKAVFRLTVWEGSPSWEVSKFMLPTRPVFKYEIVTLDDLEQFVSERNLSLHQWAERTDLPTTIRRPIVRVGYRPSLPDAYARIVGAATRADVHLFLSPRDEQATTIVTPLQPAAAGADVVSAATEIDGGETTAVCDLARIWDAADPAGEIDKIVDEALAAVSATD